MSKKEDLFMVKGATFEKGWYYMDEDRAAISLGEYEARMHVRRRTAATTTVLELSSVADEGITLELGGNTGRIDVRVSALVTATLDFDRGVYDLEIYKPLDATEVKRLVYGTIIFTDGITR